MVNRQDLRHSVLSGFSFSRALRGCFREGSVYMFVVSFQRKGKPLTLWGCPLKYFDYMQGNFGFRYVLIHFETLIVV